MDPIKVDFSKKGGPKEIVIPPDKAALKIVLSVLCSLVTAVIAFYIMLPPLNFKAYEFYGFLAIIVASYALFSAIFTGVFSKPEYLPYFKRQMIVPGVIVGVIALTVGIGYLVSSPFFRASSYSQIIDVRTDSNSADEIDKQDVLKCLDIIDKVPYATPVICGAKSAYITKKDVDEEIYYNVEMYYERRQIVEDLRKVADNDTIVKVAIYFKKEKAEEFMKYFENIGEKLTAVLSGASWIDIANKTESKGNAIKAICEKYGIAHTEAMGFGDYLNDMSLLESCGESYCMKNGHPTLKALAKYVTEKTNDENGVMEVLKTL